MDTTPQFQAVPDDVTSVERDLRFHPSTVTNPQALTAAQVAAYNEDGYVKGIRIFDEAEADDNRRYFDALLAEVMAQGGDSYSISTAHLTYGRVYDLITHPKIVAHVKDILGDNVIGWGSHYFCKMPRDGKTVSWHQDASFWPMSPSKTVTVWLAIDNADTENACMRFLAGSHNYGHLTYMLSEEDENNVLNQTVVDAEQYGTRVYDELNAGEMSMHSDLLLHGSDANASERRRCGLTLRYCAADVRAEMDWNLKGVIVSGEDVSGHWANPLRPERD
ncbi:MAG: phytanoyl-CoA dioxygenase family protein [Chloroflexota bacterium]